MPIKASISGVRGTIIDSNDFSPDIISAYVLAYGSWLIENYGSNIKVVIGRDARPSGSFVAKLIIGTLNYLGISVIDVGLATTPTVELAVKRHKSKGGIIITASHNPENWNALKLLNHQGEFLDAKDIKKVLKLYSNKKFKNGKKSEIKNKEVDDVLDYHIDKILKLKEVKRDLIKKENFKIVVDGINSVGGPAIVSLLKALGLKNIIPLNCENSGNFKHKPEPLAVNLKGLRDRVKKEKADLGLAVDPDGDRLAIVCEDGSFFGEENTLISVSKYLLSQFGGGDTVSNLSSSRALKDITEEYGGKYFASKVGEINVASLMKKKEVKIGGEGNGGVIFSKLHYGRDALLASSLFLSYLAIFKKKCSQLRLSLPKYFMGKYKIQLNKKDNIEIVFKKLKKHFSQAKTNELDGLKLDFDNSWVHLRASNTEPIIRLYIEAKTKKELDNLYNKVKKLIIN